MNTTGVSERAPVVWSSPPPLAKSPPLSILCWQMLPVFIKVYRAFVAIRGECLLYRRQIAGRNVGSWPVVASPAIAAGYDFPLPGKAGT